MRKVLEKRVDFSDGLGESCELEFVLLRQAELIGDVYGFLVQKYSGGSVIEREDAMNITEDVNVAKEIYSKLVEGEVTPISLCYVVDDLMCELEG